MVWPDCLLSTAYSTRAPRVPNTNKSPTSNVGHFLHAVGVSSKDASSLGVVKGRCLYPNTRVSLLSYYPLPALCNLLLPHYFLLSTLCPLPMNHFPLPTSHFPPLTARWPLVAGRCSLLTAHCSFFTPCVVYSQASRS